MTVCKCGAETTRLRQVWDQGQVTDEYCPTCRPDAFDRQTMPSDKKMWMGWEVDAQHYKRVYDKDGPIMMPSDSVLHDLEEQVSKRPDEDVEAEQKAIAKKRANRRLEPMDSGELTRALNVARVVAKNVEEAHATGS